MSAIHSTFVATIFATQLSALYSALDFAFFSAVPHSFESAVGPTVKTSIVEAHGPAELAAINATISATDKPSLISTQWAA